MRKRLGPIGVASGVPWYVSGHSNGNGAYVTPGRRWNELVARELDLVLTNAAVPSSHIVENCFNLFNGSRWDYGVPRRGVATVDAVINSYGVLGDTTLAHTMHAAGMRLMLASLSASQRIHHTAWTKTGTWLGTYPDVKASDGDYGVATAVSAAASITYTGKDAYVVVWGSTAASGFATLEFRLDGAVVSGLSAVDLNGRVQSFNTVNYGNALTAMPIAFKIPVASSGSHTITVTSTVAGFFFLSDLLVQHPTPQPIVVALDPHIPVHNSTEWGIIDVYNTETAAVAAEFANASTLDLRNLTLTYIDGGHYSDASQMLVADAFAGALRARVGEAGAHSGASGYDPQVNGSDYHYLDSQVSRILQDLNSRLYAKVDGLFARKTAGVPAGGAVGQALIKASGTDYDDTWQTVRRGGYRPPLNGYFFPDGVIGTGAAQINAAAILDLFPYDIEQSLTIQSMAINLTTLQVAGTLATSLGLWRDDGTGEKPDFVGGVVGTGALGVMTSGLGAKEVALAATLTPGRYWLGVLVNQTATPTQPPQFTSVSQSRLLPIPNGTSLASISRSLRIVTSSLPATNTNTYTVGATAICPLLRRSASV